MRLCRPRKWPYKLTVNSSSSSSPDSPRYRQSFSCGRQVSGNICTPKSYSLFSFINHKFQKWSIPSFSLRKWGALGYVMMKYSTFLYHKSHPSSNKRGTFSVRFRLAVCINCILTCLRLNATYHTSFSSMHNGPSTSLPQADYSHLNQFIHSTPTTREVV